MQYLDLYEEGIVRGFHVFHELSLCSIVVKHGIKMRAASIEGIPRCRRGAMREHIKVVVHFIDDIIAKGYVDAFNANQPTFHFYQGITEPILSQYILLKIKEIKAIFFVKTFEGNKGYVERKEVAAGDRVLGRIADVTFIDGEVIRGYIVDYNPLMLGFFLIPIDPDSNNIQVFVVSNAVMNVSYL